MSIQEYETLIFKELEQSPKKQKKFEELLTAIKKKSKNSCTEVADTLRAVINRLVYRGKLSVTSSTGTSFIVSQR